MVAWAFSEPRFMVHAYNTLNGSSFKVGLFMSAYGAALMLGEFGLGSLSDRLGRKPVIVVGLILFSAQFAGLAQARDGGVMAVSFVIAGRGNALYDPALSASILDLAPSEHPARALGLKSAAASLGNIVGPALMIVVTPRWPFTPSAPS